MSQYYLIRDEGTQDCIINLDAIMFLRNTPSALLIYQYGDREPIPISGDDAKILWEWFSIKSKTHETLTAQGFWS